MAVASVDTSFVRAGTGNLFILDAPTSAPATGTLAQVIDAYFGLFCADPVAKKALKGGVVPYANLTAEGVTFKVTPTTLEIDLNNAPKVKLLTGIDTAEVEFEFTDGDAAHLADAFGLNAADIVSVSASAGKAGRKLACMGSGSNYKQVTALYRMPSVKVPGEYDHFLYPLCRMVPEIDIKMSKTGAYKVKVKMSLMPSPYAFNSDGSGIYCVADTATVAAI
jgi:hypothetical protein